MTPRDRLARAVWDATIPHYWATFGQQDAEGQEHYRLIADRLIAAGVTLAPAPLALDVDRLRAEVAALPVYVTPDGEESYVEAAALRDLLDRFAAPQAPEGERL